MFSAGSPGNRPRGKVSASWDPVAATEPLMMQQSGIPHSHDQVEPWKVATLGVQISNRRCTLERERCGWCGSAMLIRFSLMTSAEWSFAHFQPGRGQITPDSPHSTHHCNKQPLPIYLPLPRIPPRHVVLATYVQWQTPTRTVTMQSLCKITQTSHRPRVQATRGRPRRWRAPWQTPNGTLQRHRRWSARADRPATLSERS